MSDYKQGFLDGIRAYAWHKDGRQWVGTTGRTLKDAQENVEKTWNYAPPPNIAQPEEEGMAAKLIEIAESNSDLYQNERMWLREAAAVLRGMREPQRGE